MSPVLGILNVISTIKDIVAFINGSPVGLIITLILDIAQVFITCIGNHAKDKTVGVYYNFDLFAGSHEAAKRSAMLYSLMGTCKLHGINPFIWLRDVLQRIAIHPINKIEDLLPHNWQPHSNS